MGDTQHESTSLSGSRRPDLMTRLGRHELAPLILVLVAAGGTWLFAEIADLVFAGESTTFDARVLLVMRSSGDSVLDLVTIAAAGFLALERKDRALVLIIIAVAGGLVLSTVLKHLFARPRPDLVPPGSAVYTASFPSGHSMMSAITYLTLGALLARDQTRKRLKAYLLCLAIFLTLLVGVSLVYLGVHWPTDILAGWTVGAVWAILCWLVVRWLQDRGQVESDGQPGPDRAGGPP